LLKIWSIQKKVLYLHLLKGEVENVRSDDLKC
jgi:hypothetical protein